MLVGLLPAQTLRRNLRLPYNDRPRIIRHPLADNTSNGETLYFKFESEPLRQMLRRIHRSIPEADRLASAPEEILDISKSTMIIEELNREAAEALENPASASMLTGSAPIDLIASAPAEINASEPVKLIASYPPEINASPTIPVASVTSAVKG